MVLAPCRRGVEFVLMFLSALLGRGGGSGWDTAGQNRALARHAQPKDNMIILDVGANDGRWIADVDKQVAAYIITHSSARLIASRTSNARRGISRS